LSHSRSAIRTTETIMGYRSHQTIGMEAMTAFCSDTVFFEINDFDTNRAFSLSVHFRN